MWGVCGVGYWEAEVSPHAPSVLGVCHCYFGVFFKYYVEGKGVVVWGLCPRGLGTIWYLLRLFF